MSENVYWVLEAAINPGRLEDLNILMAEMVESTQETEAGALNYEWAISDDQQVCHVYERYCGLAVRARPGGMTQADSGSSK